VPVVGLTLRYDRLDTFWFCLLHELAHIGRHMNGKSTDPFVDDLSLREVKGVHRDVKEIEADEWAENGLIPADDWNTSKVKDDPSPLAVVELAQRLSIHPAIIAGRIQHETRNYRFSSALEPSGSNYSREPTDGVRAAKYPTILGAAYVPPTELLLTAYAIGNTNPKPHATARNGKCAFSILGLLRLNYPLAEPASA
jgi:hypothetical protein